MPKQEANEGVNNDAPIQVHNSQINNGEDNPTEKNSGSNGNSEFRVEKVEFRGVEEEEKWAFDSLRQGAYTAINRDSNIPKVYNVLT